VNLVRDHFNIVIYFVKIIPLGNIAVELHPKDLHIILEELQIPLFENVKKENPCRFWSYYEAFT